MKKCLTGYYPYAIIQLSARVIPIQKRKDKAMINKTWQGYYISKNRKGSRWKLYVKSIYKGKITWTTDYTYAKHYTEKTAKRLDAEIDEGIRNGEFDNDILPDGEETIRNMEAVLNKFIKEYEECTTQKCHELWNIIEDIRLDIELYSKAAGERLAV